MKLEKGHPIKIQHISYWNHWNQLKNVSNFHRYPLVNSHITIENHHVSWENPLFLWKITIFDRKIHYFYGKLQFLIGKSTISMENHNFSWENPLFQWPFFHSYFDITRGIFQGFNVLALEPNGNTAKLLKAAVLRNGLEQRVRVLQASGAAKLLEF